MGKTKLTLTVDDRVVERAKKFAESNRTSVSSLVEQYLSRLSRPPANHTPERHPLVARLRGLGRPTGGEEEYRAHLEKKYGR